MIKARKAPTSGFSVSELLVVVALFGMVFLFGAPNVLEWYRNYETSTAAREVATLVQLTRQKAITRNTSMTIKVDSASHKVEIYETVVAPATPVVEQSRHIIESLALTDNEVDFQPNGTAEFAVDKKCEIVSVTDLRGKTLYVNVFVSGVVRTTKDAAHTSCS